MNNEKKKIVLGTEDFKEIIDNNIYYADKTMLIEKFFSHFSKVSIVTRPHKFGKSINQSMMRRFLEDEITEHGERADNRYLFDGLYISGCDGEILKHQQQYPVIFLSFKDARGSDFEETWQKICEAIAGEFRRHRYVLECEGFMKWQRNEYIEFMNGTANYSKYTSSLKLLSEYLDKYHGCRPFLLADAYDTPLESAYMYGFYDKMANYICNMFEDVCKTNPHLERAVLTGILDVTAKSAISGFNNFTTNDIFHPYPDDCFGFTQEDTETALEYYGLSDCIDEVREWYGNYAFGKRTIYNQWSVLSYIKTIYESQDRTPQVYWPNPPYSDVIRNILCSIRGDIRYKIEMLTDGQSINELLYNFLTWEDIDTDRRLWSFLAAAGYLRAGAQYMQGHFSYIDLAIPNLEIKAIYIQLMSECFDSMIEQLDKSPLIKALEQGDCESAETFIQTHLAETDRYLLHHKENWQYIFVTKLLGDIKDYSMVSDSDKSDIMLVPKVPQKCVIALKIAVSSTCADIEAKCSEALKQIADKQYAEAFINECHPAVQKYGIGFYRFDCMVKQC